MSEFLEWCEKVKPFIDAALDGETIQYQGSGGEWEDKLSGKLFADGSYRIKPKTINVNGFEIVAGEKSSLSKGDLYFVPCPRKMVRFVSSEWLETSYDERILKDGLVHLTVENAIAHAKAMLGIDPKPMPPMPPMPQYQTGEV